MEYVVTDILEGLRIDRFGHLNKLWTVYYTVNGTPYTKEVSDADFQAGKTNQIVADEVRKLEEIYLRKPK